MAREFRFFGKGELAAPPVCRRFLCSGSLLHGEIIKNIQVCVCVRIEQIEKLSVYSSFLLFGSERPGSFSTITAGALVFARSG